MTTLHSYPIPSGWQYHLARPGSANGDQKRDEFEAKLLSFGDCRLLWLPRRTETTTSTDRSRNAATITYDATVASRYGTLGSLVTVDFDGSDDEADTPDADRLSFGDGTYDQALTIAVLCKPDVNNAAMTLLAKENAATAEELNLGLNASGHLVLTLTDESASGTLTATYASAVGTDWTLLGASYDGSRANTGMAAYKNGAKQTVSLGGASYTAMENTAALVHLFSRYTTKERFFDGQGALAVLWAKHFSQDDWWELKTAVNAVSGLSL